MPWYYIRFPQFQGLTLTWDVFKYEDNKKYFEDAND